MRAAGKEDKFPRHVGLIGDGVRRWSQKNKINLKDAYFAAGRNVGEFIDFFMSCHTQILSLYLLSKENLSRSKADLSAAIETEQFFLETYFFDFIKKWQCSVFHVGDSESLPKSFSKVIKKICGVYLNSNRKIYLLIGYNPFDELKQAISKDALAFQKHLWVIEPVDLVIRTSGEMRISNFLPLQSGYAEFAFFQKHINEMEIEDWENALSIFQHRTQRYGR